ncbi:hypothetical protein NQ314_017143 [Rhamnusium bicolor]|uniref:Uncharacterized protein n=1 Tax=Rhamnusium bicolor TaxID=1586634 RepID=A0AAV8WTZ5_9CUCU|nr:hypothetical protein NQ314_017143 [Rhamnusium bicolor]
MIDILLNEKRLTPDLLSEKNPFEPKLRRAKSKSHISMEVPPISIGFFVLPGARIPVCINEEKEINFLLEEIAEDQNLPLSEEMVLKFGSRSSFVNNPTLEEIAQRMKKEMQSDEKFYNNDQMLNFKLNTLKQRIQDDPAEDKINQRGRKFFIERAKFTDRQKKHRDVERRKDELKKFLSEKAKASDSYKHEIKIESKSKHLELTSDEVEKILKDRAKARAAQRNIIFTDEELDALMQKASRKFLKHKFKRSVPTEKRQKRDINMQLLDRQIYFTPTSADHSVKDYHGEVPRASKHLSKHKRDLNMKLLDYRAKLEDNRQRLEDKKYEILGNTKNIKENIKDRIKRLKHNKRYRRDINMELLKTKSEGQKTKSLKEAEKKSKPKSFFKDKEEKEATIRKPGQISEEFVKEESRSVEQEKPINIEVYAELAVPEEYEDDGEEDGLDFFKTNTKPNKHNTSDKRIKNNRFDDVHPKSKKSKQGKKSLQMIFSF